MESNTKARLQPGLQTVIAQAAVPGRRAYAQPWLALQVWSICRVSAWKLPRP